MAARIGVNFTTVNGTATGAAVNVLAAKNTRRFLEIYNNSDTVLWFRFGATAAANTGIQLPAGSTWRSPGNVCPKQALSVIGTNTKTFIVTHA